MGFRIVDKSYFAFETDLPPSMRNIHTSGVLHAVRSTHASASEQPTSHSFKGREEHTFSWINNSLHIELAIQHLEKNGFDCVHGIVFIPYSTKRNWLDRYPHADPALETTMGGEVVVHLDWRPNSNGLSEVGEQHHSMTTDGGSGSVRKAIGVPANVGEMKVSANYCAEEDYSLPPYKRRKKLKQKNTVPNMVKDNSRLPNAERDELHIEIYNYLSWLHGKLAAIERENEELDIAKTMIGISEKFLSNNEDDTKTRFAKRNKTSIPGVDVSKLKSVVDTFEITFAVILNAEKEMEQQDDSQVLSGSKGAPFLEEALSDALRQVVDAREMAGKPKRSRTWQRKSLFQRAKPRKMIKTDFDEYFEKLVKYKEEHGDCLIPTKYAADPGLGNWVFRVRQKMILLQKRGQEVEEVPPGKKLTCKTLTAERLERLNSIGFVWRKNESHKSWDERFEDLIEYYETNGKWPPQSFGTLGDWTHRQRTLYSKKDPAFMEEKADRMDSIGFDWTPRGYSRMKWDEGFALLMAFGESNGHFDVPTSPELDRNSQEHRLHKWVESLHDMYRSFELGRQSGSLTNERVQLLVSNGFVFRSY